MKIPNTKAYRIAGTLVLALASTTAGPTLLAADRPISEFLSKQGMYVVYDDATFAYLGCENAYYTDQLCPQHPRWLLGWLDPATGTGMIMDYAGEDALWLKQIHGINLGTTSDGKVTETPLPDGRAAVSVVVHTENALTWAVNPLDDWFASPMVFGCPWTDLLGTVEHPFLALGDCTFRIKFINPAPNAPLPDVAELFECRFGDIVSVAFEGQAHGPLRAGFGVPDGTPGLIHTAQMNGLFRVATRVNPHSIVAQWWGQPGKIFLQPVGK